MGSVALAWSASMHSRPPQDLKETAGFWTLQLMQELERNAAPYSAPNGVCGAEVPSWGHAKEGLFNVTRGSRPACNDGDEGRAALARKQRGLF